jgi:hypothetical protein
MDFKIVDFDRRQRGARIELTAKVTGKHEPMFQSLAGVNSVPFETETTVTAATKLSGIRFTPTFGSGYLDKEFQLWVNRPNRPSPELLATYNWRSTAPFTFRNGTSPGYLRASTRGSIDLGEFTDFFMTVEVYDRWNTYTREQLVEVYGQDYKLASNEPGHGDHFVVNGRVLDVDEAVDFSSEFNCDTGRQNFEWEDAPGLAQVGTDFRFNVSGECNALDPDTLRISR